MRIVINYEWVMHYYNSFLFFSSRHQGFGILSVILANHAIKLLTSLFQDLQVEALHRVNKQATPSCTIQNIIHQPYFSNK